MEEKRNLPSITELYEGDIDLKRDINDLNILLNQFPADKWLKKHPTVTKKVIDATGIVKYVPIEYLSIERIEWLLTKIFLEWKVEIRQVQVIANSVCTTIRLYYRDVLSNELLWQDGVGAAPIQTDKGAGAADFNKVKADGVMKAAPAAESYAVKDAAHKIGRLFGKDLNRADQIMYDSLANLPKDQYETLFEEELNDNAKN